MDYKNLYNLLNKSDDKLNTYSKKNFPPEQLEVIVEDYEKTNKTGLDIKIQESLRLVYIGLWTN